MLHPIQAEGLEIPFSDQAIVTCEYLRLETNHAPLEVVDFPLPGSIDIVVRESHEPITLDMAAMLQLEAEQAIAERLAERRGSDDVKIGDVISVQHRRLRNFPIIGQTALPWAWREVFTVPRQPMLNRRRLH